MVRSLTSIAEEALAAAKALDAYLAANGLPFTSPEEDTLTELPLELKEARNVLVNSSQYMKQLALGAQGRLSESMFMVSTLYLDQKLFLYFSTTLELDIRSYWNSKSDCRRDCLGCNLQVSSSISCTTRRLCYFRKYQQQVLSLRRS